MGTSLDCRPGESDHVDKTTGQLLLGHPVCIHSVHALPQRKWNGQVGTVQSGQDTGCYTVQFADGTQETFKQQHLYPMVPLPSTLERGMAVWVREAPDLASSETKCGMGLIVDMRAADMWKVRFSDGSLHNFSHDRLQPLVPAVSPEAPVFPSSGTCVVCLEPDCASFIGVPCGHQCVCKKCSEDLGQGAHCPICRTKVSNFMQVFISEPSFDKERLQGAEERASQAQEIQRQSEAEKRRLEEKLQKAQALAAQESGKVAALDFRIRDLRDEMTSKIGAAEERASQAQEIQRQSEEEKCRLEEALQEARALAAAESAKVAALDGRIEELRDEMTSKIGAAEERASQAQEIQRQSEERASQAAEVLAASLQKAGDDNVEFQVHLEAAGGSEVRSASQGEKRFRDDWEEADLEEQPWWKCQRAWLEQQTMVIGVDD